MTLQLQSLSLKGLGSMFLCSVFTYSYIAKMLVEKTSELQYLDKRLDRITQLLEEGNASVLESSEELQQKITHLHDKVDRVQDTVAYIKRKLSTFTPFRLAFTLLLFLGLFVIFIYYFHIIHMR